MFVIGKQPGKCFVLWLFDSDKIKPTSGGHVPVYIPIQRIFLLHVVRPLKLEIDRLAITKPYQFPRYTNHHLVAAHIVRYNAYRIPVLCGGSLGLSIKENIKIIYPYLQKNRYLLNDLESFYYYDDQVVPHAVFTAVVTNYYLKQFGTDSFKRLMKTEQYTKISIEDFLLKFCGVNDPSSFLMREMKLYLEENLEYSDLFTN